MNEYEYKSKKEVLKILGNKSNNIINTCRKK